MKEDFKLPLIKFGKFFGFIILIFSIILSLSFFSEKKIEEGFREGAGKLLELYNSRNGTNLVLSQDPGSFVRSENITLKAEDGTGSVFHILTFSDNNGYLGPVLPGILYPGDYTGMKDLEFLGFLGLDDGNNRDLKSEVVCSYYIKKAWDILKREDSGEQ